MDWYSPLNPGFPISTSNNSISLLFGVIPPGVYTMVATNMFNGCTTVKTVTVTSLDAWPTFGVSSTTNFSVGCSPLNQTTLIITNPVSTQTPPATCSYTFLPPGFAGTLSPGPYPPIGTSTITTLPGTWTLVVLDNSNNCKIMLPVAVIQNTVAPDVSAFMQPITQTLTCLNPILLATGESTTANTIVEWIQPAGNQIVTTSTIVVGPATGRNTSTTSLTYATYTVVATNSVNACKTFSKVVINQNFKPPVSSPLISVDTPTAVYCNVGIDPVVLTTGASTITSGVPNAFVANPCWNGPSPQVTVCGASSYSVYVPGIYSLTVMDSYNGCTTTGTINVVDKTQPPVLTASASMGTLDCGSSQTSLLMAITGSTNDLKYWYYTFPTGAAFTPTSAPIPDGTNQLLNGTASQSVNVSLTGYYQFVVTNTITGCRAFGSFTVTDGSIKADFTPDFIYGYAPLTVNFTDNSFSSLGNSSITSIWSFGNGTSITTISNTPTSAVYAAPGTYTVMLLAQKGDCIDTVSKIIKVDLPSKLEVPNIFTPNGDGSNDLFLLKTANLTEIEATIFDRWGNKVYEISSSTGNIAWDGKNLAGKDCAAGVYFFIITAKGKDDKKYNTKGNLSLIR